VGFGKNEAMAYAGDVTARQAWEQLSKHSGATLVDVRTPAEWSYVGTPDLSPLGKTLVKVPWQNYPGMALNPRFADELGQAGVAKDDPVFFLCRSGVRSRAAAEAMTALGYTRCYNVADGFEGPHDGERHRGRLAGWKASGLPWTQEEGDFRWFRRSAPSAGEPTATPKPSGPGSRDG
jgi:rhodanese-related sulfurtransferase